jgi:two-component system cell cycle sensor histidine kinase/response regulator CckA
MPSEQKAAPNPSQERMEGALPRAEINYRSIFEDAGDGIYQTTPDGKFLAANPAMARMLGFASPEELIRERTDIARQGYARPELREEFKRLLERDGTVHGFEYEACRKNGGKVWVSETARAIRDADGRVTLYEGFFKDITERKRAEEELRQAVSLLQSTFESTADGILLVDRAGKIVSFNSRFVSLWQISQSILDKRDDKAAINHVLKQLREPDAFLRKIRELYSTPEAESFDILEFKDGRVLERYSCAQRLDGKPIGRVWSFRDITGHKRTEKALLESQVIYQSFVEHLPAGVFRKDRAGRFVFVNSMFCKLKGLKTDEITGKTPAELAVYEATSKHPQTARQHTLIQGGEHHELMIRTGKPIELEEIYPQPDGTMEYFHVVKSPVFDPDGQFIGSQGILFDITEHRRLEAQLRQSQKMEAFGQLAAGVAHDFNNILTVIQGNLSLLQGGQLSKEEQSSALDQTMASAERATSLTRQLLTFGRRQLMKFVDLDLNEVVGNITKMLQRLIGEHITLETRFAPGGAPVHADLSMMEQALINLVINSRDAMPKGGRLLLQTMAIVLSEDDVQLKPKARAGKFIRLSVSDTGDGIAPEHLPNIFEPFFTTKDVGKGTGLGLATVFGIIEQHNGWIEVESEQNKGTTFHLFLPRLTQGMERTT